MTTQRTPDWKHPITWSNVVVALATVANVGVSACLYIATNQSVAISRDVFQSTNRPYVGVDEIKVTPDPQTKLITWSIQLKNFGTVPAYNSISDLSMKENGKAIQMLSVPSKPITMFPGNVSLMGGTSGPQIYDDIMMSRRIVTMKFKALYKGPEGPNQQTYTHCEEYRYEPLATTTAMISIGTCSVYDK